jgi:hypothetical protein
MLCLTYLRKEVHEAGTISWRFCQKVIASGNDSAETRPPRDTVVARKV